MWRDQPGTVRGFGTCGTNMSFIEFEPDCCSTYHKVAVMEEECILAAPESRLKAGDRVCLVGTVGKTGNYLRIRFDGGEEDTIMTEQEMTLAEHISSSLFDCKEFKDRLKHERENERDRIIKILSSNTAITIDMNLNMRESVLHSVLKETP